MCVCVKSLKRGIKSNSYIVNAFLILCNKKQSTAYRQIFFVTFPWKCKLKICSVEKSIVNRTLTNRIQFNMLIFTVGKIDIFSWQKKENVKVPVIGFV